MKLPDRSWENPLGNIPELLKVHLTETKLREFEAGYSRFQRKLSHLGLIWERLKNDTDAYEKLLEVVAKTVDLVKTGKTSYTHTPEEQSAIQFYREKSKFIYLDFEDFFIHAKILMDRIAWLTRFFIKGVEFSRFTKLRKFFLKNVPFLEDKEYARYIRENTAWYETMLESYRDKLIVHDATSDTVGIFSSPRHLVTLASVRLRPLPEEEWSEHWQGLLKLREKYKDRIPGLAEIPLNAIELIRHLDVHSDLIEPSDLKVLEKIRHEPGAKFPDVNSITDHIMDLLNFYSNHFSNKLAQSSKQI
ncbi:MAG: hypothetical protein H3Z53_00765 [archaeon]|nr:hypothetical protein [archaeon]